MAPGAGAISAPAAGSRPGGMTTPASSACFEGADRRLAANGSGQPATHQCLEAGVLKQKDEGGDEAEDQQPVKQSQHGVVRTTPAPAGSSGRSAAATS